MSRPLVTAATLAVGLVSSAAHADITDQHVSVDVSQSDVTTIDVTASFTATGTQSSLSFFIPAVPIVSAEVDGVATTFGPHPTYPQYLTRIDFPSTLEAGEKAEIHVVMSGEASCGGSATYCRRTPDETIFTAGAPGAAWFLSDPFTTDAFTGSVDVRILEGQTAVSGLGAPTVTSHGDGTESWLYEMAHPVTYVGLYVGTPDTLSSDSGFDVTAYFDASSEDTALVQQAVDVVSAVVPIYEERYGALPTDQARLIAVPSSFAFGAIGMLANVFVNSVVFTEQGSYLVEQGMAHELGHSWFGNLTSSDGVGGAFLGEGMAEYAGWRALGLLHGDEKRTAGMRMNAVWYMFGTPEGEDAPILGIDQSAPGYVFVTYHKGALALRALEEQVGAEAFDEALRQLVTRGPGGASIVGLVEDVATSSGFDAAPWVDQWLERSGYPEMVVTSDVAGEDVTLTVEVLGDWQLHLPVRFVFADGEMQTEAIAVGAGVSEHAFALDRAPVAVQIDPDWTMAREIVPSQPADVTLDGVVDGADLIDVALRQGGYMPATRRVDGSYDPLYDVQRDGMVDAVDLQAVVAAAGL